MWYQLLGNPRDAYTYSVVMYLRIGGYLEYSYVAGSSHSANALYTIDVLHKKHPGATRTMLWSCSRLADCGIAWYTPAKTRMGPLEFSPSEKTNLFFASVVNIYDAPKSLLFVLWYVSGITLVLSCKTVHSNCMGTTQANGYKTKLQKDPRILKAP